jgi:hypothetical protein
MGEACFSGIAFNLPSTGKVLAAREIGRQCGIAWYAADANALPARDPDAIATWSIRARRAWREGLAAGWHAAKNAVSAVPSERLYKGALVGYARVSSQDQTTDLQLDALAKVGCSRVFSESASGAQRDRPELARALDYVRPGDTLMV